MKVFPLRVRSLCFLLAVCLFLVLRVASGHSMANSESFQEIWNVSDTQTSTPEPNLTRITTKAVGFEILSTSLETGLFLLFYGSAVTPATTYFVISLLTGGAVYVLHEYAWELLAPPQTGPPDTSRLAAKTLSFRGFSTLRTFMLSNILGSPALANSLGFLASYVVLDSALYAAMEHFDGLLARSHQ